MWSRSGKSPFWNESVMTQIPPHLRTLYISLATALRTGKGISWKR